jgi:hypothetical protein
MSPLDDASLYDPFLTAGVGGLTLCRDTLGRVFRGRRPDSFDAVRVSGYR